MSVLSKIVRSNAGFIVVSHTWFPSSMNALLVEQNMRAALKVADRAYVLRVGRVTREGSAAALRDADDIKQAYLGL